MSLASYQVVFFTDMVESLYVRYMYGWLLVSIIFITILYNMAIVLLMMIKQIFLIFVKSKRIIYQNVSMGIIGLMYFMSRVGSAPRDLTEERQI